MSKERVNRRRAQERVIAIRKRIRYLERQLDDKSFPETTRMWIHKEYKALSWIVELLDPIVNNQPTDVPYDMRETVPKALAVLEAQGEFDDATLDDDKYNVSYTPEQHANFQRQYNKILARHDEA